METSEKTKLEATKSERKAQLGISPEMILGHIEGLLEGWKSEDFWQTTEEEYRSLSPERKARIQELLSCIETGWIVRVLTEWPECSTKRVITSLYAAVRSN